MARAVTVPSAVVNPSPQYLAYRSGAAFARAVPAPLVTPLTDAASRVAGRLLRDRRSQVERNVARVLPDVTPAERRAVVDATFESYARYWAESFRLPGTPLQVIEAEHTAEGVEHLEQALAAGNGVILGLPHLGGWEWGAFWLTGVRGWKVTAVAEALEPPDLADWFVGLRREFGLEIVPLDNGAGAASIRALKANHILCLVCDRDVAGGGVEVEFFGERTTLPSGPATLALRTGAPILPTAVYFEGSGHHSVIEPPVPAERQGSLREDVARVTQSLAVRLEALIRRAPEQWHLLQPNWPSDPGYPHG
ncbi:MAG TPA: phosphatidylinositol mannoside acyltransferase [Acidimicrobiales bacterium]|jgi:KDO2-lipid IV(A) lauroyltransferase|nr:phosphatidylinositol mannoside acyltransferase [Acidimicrobiales bacterium]